MSPKKIRLNSYRPLFEKIMFFLVRFPYWQLPVSLVSVKVCKYFRCFKAVDTVLHAR